MAATDELGARAGPGRARPDRDRRRPGCSTAISRRDAWSTRSTCRGGRRRGRDRAGERAQGRRARGPSSTARCSPSPRTATSSRPSPTCRPAPTGRCETAAPPCTSAASSMVWVRLGARGSLLSTADGTIELAGAPGRGRRRHRRRRRDARRLLPRAARAAATPVRGRPLTATPPPRSPSPARTPSDPTSPRVSSRPHWTRRNEVTAPHPDLAAHREVAQALADGAPSSRWRARSSATACPTRRTSRWRPRSRGSSARAARSPRPSPCWTAGRGRPDAARPRTARHQPRRDQGQRARPAVRRRARHGTARPRSPRPCGSRRWPGIRVFVTGGLGGVHRGAQRDLRHQRRPDRAGRRPRSRSSRPA